jgi:hypothetical protein
LDPVALLRDIRFAQRRLATCRREVCERFDYCGLADRLVPRQLVNGLERGRIVSSEARHRFAMARP